MRIADKPFNERRSIIKELNEERVATQTFARFGVDASTIFFWVFNLFLALSGAWFWIVRIGAWILDLTEGR